MVSEDCIFQAARSAFNKVSDFEYKECHQLSVSSVGHSYGGRVQGAEGAKKDGHVLAMKSIRASFFQNSIECAFIMFSFLSS